MANDYFKRTHWTARDEYYTPSILVEAIVPYLKMRFTDATIWCPFDTKNSEFVLCLREAGFNVVHSHLWTGEDFFKYEPKHYDAIISNPPFTLKREVFRRLFDLKKPFAMLMGLPILNYQDVGNFFFGYQEKGQNLQLLVFDKKVSFDGNTSSFNTSFFCSGILQRDLMFHHLPHNNSRKHYVASRMIIDQPEEEEE